MQEGRWEGQRSIDDIVVRRGRNETKFRLVHLLNLTKLHKLMTKDCALFNDVAQEFVRIVLRNEFM